MKFVLKNCFAICILAGLASCHPKPADKAKSEDLETDKADEAIRRDFWMMRDPQLNAIPHERLEVARKKASSLANSASLRAMALSWTERGPNNIGGRTRSILVDSRDATGNTVLAGSVSGGIFRTTNFLSNPPTWAPVDDRMTNMAITALLQDRTNGAIMYAGTGEGWFNIDAITGAGIFKSSNGGITWSKLASTINFEYVQDLAQDNNGNLYAAVRNLAGSIRGVQRSTDGGATWTQVLGLPLATPTFTTGRAADLEVASNGDVYATLGIFSRTQVFKSSSSNGINTGALNTWNNITPVVTGVTQRGELAIAPSNPQRLYLFLEDSITSQVKNVYRSSDGGTVWETLPAPAGVNNGNVSQVWYNLIAAVDPTNPDVLVAGGYNVVKSTDGGNTFTAITASNTVHVDQHVLLYTSASSLIIGNDGGIYYSANANTAAPTYTNKNNGFNVTQFYGADMHPTNLNYFLAGAQDNNTQKFTTAGMNSTVPVVGGDGGFPHIDQTDGQLQIAATTGNNFYRSTNGGIGWTAVPGSNNNGPFISPSDLDDVSKTLYSSNTPGSYMYFNNLTAPNPTSGSNPLAQIGASREVTAVKVDPFSNQTVWLGASWSFDASPNNMVIPVVMKVTSANTATPSVALSSTIGAAATTSGAYVSSIDVDPNNGNHLLVTLSNYGVPSVFESTDGGASWSGIEGDLPDMPVYWGLFAPINAQLNGATGGNGGIMLATELGVWSTSNINGASTQWIINSTSFPNVRTDMLKLRYSDFLVLAATHGRGLFTTNLPFVTTAIPSVDNTKNFIKYTSVTPQQLYIKTGNLNTTKMEIRIFDANGRLVRSLQTQYSDQLVSINGLAGSSYIVKITGNKGEQYTYHFVK